MREKEVRLRRSRSGRDFFGDKEKWTPPDGTAYSGVPLARFFEGGANDHQAVIAAMAKANTEALDAMI